MPIAARIVSRLSDIAPAETSILSPAMAGLPVGIASVLASLPIHDVNGRLLAELSERNLAVTAATRAGVFAVDPFRSPEGLLAELHGKGFVHVINWPSVSIMGPDLVRDLSLVGFGYEQEVQFVRRAVAAGWTVTGTVMDLHQASMMLSAGCSGLLFHPPLDKIATGFHDKATLAAFSEVETLAKELGRTAALYAEVDNRDRVPGGGSVNLVVFEGGSSPT